MSGSVQALMMVKKAGVPPPLPVASFTRTPSGGTLPLAVQCTDTSTDAPGATYAWTFGDGGTSTAKNPTHVYAGTGTYTIGLTIRVYGVYYTAPGQTVQVTAAVVPVAAFTAVPLSGQVPLSVQFTDTSVNASGASYAWVFGDGATSTAQNPQHTYNAAGNWNAQLTITVAAVPYASPIQVIAAAAVPPPTPVASFTRTPASGLVPLSVQFTDTSLNAGGATYYWVFGDGGTSTAQNPQHTYNSPGTYNPQLTITVGGTGYASPPQTVTVSAVPVAAYFRTPSSGPNPLSVQFYDQSNPAPSAWSWNFGDGGVSSAQNPQHTYLNYGTFTTTLNVTIGGQNYAAIPQSVTATPVVDGYSLVCGNINTAFGRSGLGYNQQTGDPVGSVNPLTFQGAQILELYGDNVEIVLTLSGIHAADFFHGLNLPGVTQLNWLNAYYFNSVGGVNTQWKWNTPWLWSDGSSFNFSMTR